MTNRISLYFHIPFCVRKCDYCAFYSLPAQGDEIKQAYFQALIAQINGFETDKTVSTVYFGGGTPPLLGVDRICSLIGRLKEKFAFEQGAEITVEINPGTVEKADLVALKKAGVNRLSVGIQSADDGVLRSLGRIHSFEQAKSCILDAKEVGFDNVSADIIFALPNQDFHTFISGVEKIADLGVNHISAYSLQLEEGTPLYCKRETLSFPDEEEEERQYDALCQILKGRGFEHYEISSFCQKGFESKHNLTYWTLGDYFGFGAGAHSFFENKRFYAVSDLKEFMEKSKISPFAPTNFDSAEPISSEEAEEERIMLGLRTSKGVLIPERATDKAKRIADLGFGSFEGGILRLNSRGFRVSNEIISEILI